MPITKTCCCRAASVERTAPNEKMNPAACYFYCESNKSLMKNDLSDVGSESN